MLETELVFFRTLHYAALLALFGLSLFPLYATRGNARSLPVESCGQTKRLFTAASLGLLSGIILFCCVAATMVGSWNELGREELYSVGTGTTFGRIWIAHSALTASIMALTLIPRFTSAPSAPLILTLLSGVLIASLAFVGHAQDGAGASRIVHIVADVLHLLAAGAWLGGIAGLLALLAVSARTASRDRNEAVIVACQSFAGLGTVAVATLVVSGALNTWLLAGTLRGLVTSFYGQLLMVKLALFGAMLALAALNRFKLVPALAASVASEGSSSAVSRLWRHVAVEQALGFAVVAAVAALGTMEPAINTV